jgi:cyclopropane fatty-acyl-phospholipid synthase-like methyltransferase
LPRLWTLQGNSAAYFGPQRDYWWNEDFLELVVSGFGLEATESLLDLGCGLGHWSWVLARVLAQLKKVVGIDAEWGWAKQVSLAGGSSAAIKRFQVLRHHRS